MQQKRNNVLKGRKTKGNTVAVAVVAVIVRVGYGRKGFRSLEMTLPNCPVSLIEELMDLH
jgi:hypothetical protein